MVPGNIAFHPAAIAEAAAAVRWYGEISPSIASAFISELDRAIDCIAASPDSWPPYLENTRRFIFKRFPFFLVYRVNHGAIEVVAVAHGKRKPGYWTPRSPSM